MITANFRNFHSPSLKLPGVELELTSSITKNFVGNNKLLNYEIFLQYACESVQYRCIGV